MAYLLVHMSGSTTLIYDGYECWQLSSEAPTVPEKELAPQMHNIRMSPHFEEFRQEDEFPFPVISEMFQKKIPVVTLLSMLCVCLDPDSSDELRQQAASCIESILSGQYAEHALREVRRVLLEQALPERLDFNVRVIELMPVQLVHIIQQVHHKYRGFYILA